MVDIADSPGMIGPGGVEEIAKSGVTITVSVNDELEPT
jgi:hypothetical protein